MDESAGVEVYQSTFSFWISLGGLLSLAFICLGVFRFRILGQLVCVFAATIALWFGLWYGVHMGYGAWQNFPNAGEDAYADGAQLIGSLMFGWIPAGLLCLALWGVLALVKRLAKGKPDSAPDETPVAT
jgi:hypothetical protein